MNKKIYSIMNYLIDWHKELTPAEIRKIMKRIYNEGVTELNFGNQTLDLKKWLNGESIIKLI